MGLIWLYFVGIKMLPSYTKNAKWNLVVQRVQSFLDLDDGSYGFSWRKFGIKLFLSALMGTALYCGFCDCYELMASSGKNIGFCVIGAIIDVMLSLYIMCWFSISIRLLDRKDFISDELLRFNQSKACNKVMNIAIICSWIAIFAFLCWFCGNGHIFAMIGVATFVTIVVGFVLGLTEAFIYVIIRFIILPPIIYFAKWLAK